MQCLINGCFFFSSRRRHTRWPRDWSSDVCSSDLVWQQRDSNTSTTPTSESSSTGSAGDDDHESRIQVATDRLERAWNERNRDRKSVVEGERGHIRRINCIGETSDNLL